MNGVNGVEVQTTRLWDRCEQLGLSRLVFVNMLDRERADFFTVLEQLRGLSNRCVAVNIPIGREHELKGIVDLFHMRLHVARGRSRGDPVDIPEEVAAEAADYREKLVDAVVETDEALMERYLDEGEVSGDELAAALKRCRLRTSSSRWRAAQRRRTSARPGFSTSSSRESPRRPSSFARRRGQRRAAFVFKTVADPFAGGSTCSASSRGALRGLNLVNPRTKGKERIGQLLVLQGKDHETAPSFVAGDIGAVAKLKDVMTGDLLVASDEGVELPNLEFPQPVMSFAITPKAKGDEEKMATALRRLAEEDPTLVLRRDEQTGEQLLAGLSQIHVEVAVDRLHRRFGVDVDLHQPRVPYLETIRKESRAQSRYKKQTGGRGQFGDCHIVLEPIPGHEGYEFVDKIVGGVILKVSVRP